MAEYDLTEIMEAYRRKWEAYRPYVAGYKPPAYRCQYCKDIGYLDLYPQNPRKPAEGKIGTVMPCPYCRIAMLKDISGIVAEYRNLDIQKFPWETYKTLPLKLKKIVESFVYDFYKWQEENVGLYIYSKAKGSGKTMIANAICGSICTRYNLAARFTKVEDYLSDIRKTFDSKSKDELSKVNMRKYYETDLLVLDDLGVSKIPDWGKDKLHELINERYKAGKLCIITTNFELEKLPICEATVDRINDMCMLLHWPEEAVRAIKAETKKNKILQYVNSCDKFTNCDKTPFERGVHR